MSSILVIISDKLYILFLISSTNTLLFWGNYILCGIKPLIPLGISEENYEQKKETNRD